MSFKEKLENWRTSINRAGSGEELYILLLNYKKFINKNWMDDFGDPGNWKSGIKSGHQQSKKESECGRNSKLRRSLVLQRRRSTNSPFAQSYIKISPLIDERVG